MDEDGLFKLFKRVLQNVVRGGEVTELLVIIITCTSTGRGLKFFVIKLKPAPDCVGHVSTPSALFCWVPVKHDLNSFSMQTRNSKKHRIMWEVNVLLISPHINIVTLPLSNPTDILNACEKCWLSVPLTFLWLWNPVQWWQLCLSHTSSCLNFQMLLLVWQQHAMRKDWIFTRHQTY